MNAALCIRDTPEDYDGWKPEGWNGKDFFAYMAKVRPLALNSFSKLTTNTTITLVGEVSSQPLV
jgi:hypothetical protein